MNTAVDSIANMATKKKTAPPVSTPESRALASAIAKSGMVKAAIADHMDVSPSMVSQWASGLRPVTADKAVRLGKLVNADPKAISADFRKVQDSSGGQVTSIRPAGKPDDRPYDLVIARLENDIHALNLALGALAYVMVEHRPAEATDAAAAMRRLVPAKFQDMGLVHELIALLEKPPKRQ